MQDLSSIEVRCTTRSCDWSEAASKGAKICRECGGVVTYRVRFRNQAGSSRAKSFKSRKDAIEFRDSTRVQVRSGEYRDPGLGRITLREYAALYFAEVRDDNAAKWAAGVKVTPSERTVEKYERVYRLYLDRPLGSKRLAEIGVGDVERIQRRTPSPWQADQAVAFLSVLLNRARRERPARIKENVCALVPLLKPERKTKRRVLRWEETVRVAEEIEPRYRAFVVTAYVAALRWSEAIAIRVSDLDLDAGTITIARTLDEKRGFRVGPTKTGKTITKPIDAETVALLRWHLAEFPPIVSEDPRWNGLVFSQPNPRRGRTGEKIHAIPSHVFAKAWKPALVAAGIEENVWPMWLRHSALTEAVLVDGTKAAADLAGHSDTRMVDRIYVEIDDKARREAADRRAAYRAARIEGSR